MEGASLPIRARLILLLLLEWEMRKVGVVLPVTLIPMVVFMESLIVLKRPLLLLKPQNYPPPQIHQSPRPLQERGGHPELPALLHLLRSVLKFLLPHLRLFLVQPQHG